MEKISLLFVIVALIGCATTHDKYSCEISFIRFDGNSNSELCWNSKNALIKKLDTINDENERLIESKLLPEGGQLQLIWNFSTAGNFIEYATGNEKRTSNQTTPISLIIYQDNRQIKCGDILKGDDKDNDEHESIIVCNLTTKPKNGIEVGVIDLDGFEVARFKGK